MKTSDYERNKIKNLNLICRFEKRQNFMEIHCTILWYSADKSFFFFWRMVLGMHISTVSVGLQSQPKMHWILSTKRRELHFLQQQNNCYRKTMYLKNNYCFCTVNIWVTMIELQDWKVQGYNNGKHKDWHKDISKYRVICCL